MAFLGTSLAIFRYRRGGSVGVPAEPPADEFGDRAWADAFDLAFG